MGNLKELLEGLVKGDEKVKPFFISQIRKIASQEQIRKEASQESLEEFLKKRLGKDYHEEAFSELRLKVFLMYRKGSLGKKESINFSYLRKMIRSCLWDLYRRESKVDFISLESLSYENEEGKVISFEERFGKSVDKGLEIRVRELFEILLKVIPERDYDVFCYYLYKELYSKEVVLENLSKSNLYKRWERLKKKLARELPYEPTPEEFRQFCEKFLSEICNKRSYKFKGGKKDGA